MTICPSTPVWRTVGAVECGMPCARSCWAVETVPPLMGEPGVGRRQTDRPLTRGGKGAVEERDELPDVRDGLTRRERVVLHVLRQLQRERPGRSVPTLMLYGRVVEHMDMSQAELLECLQRLGVGPAG